MRIWDAYMGCVYMRIWENRIMPFPVHAHFDAQTNGNLLYYGNLTASKTINSGDQLTFAISGITVTES